MLRLGYTYIMFDGKRSPPIKMCNMFLVSAFRSLSICGVQFTCGCCYLLLLGSWAAITFPHQTHNLLMIHDSRNGKSFAATRHPIFEVCNFWLVESYFYGYA
jgi:hypothetical protein